MENIYNEFIKEIEETGMLSLIHRKEIWKVLEKVQKMILRQGRRSGFSLRSRVSEKVKMMRCWRVYHYMKSKRL